ncbi:hypothetical protein [uncultured Senegalimassilia sp.]|jgi:hypothetical protein|uniref:hypothetical protein n=1 Tax=uncultured Senegalimassilia sp. TaxID=1714350 RepID=UPI0020538AD7|nr:hypothetical protein [uncultured Senegalimassilia sp.]DAL86218.1 MAG TPA: hypothetical protein [Caudoviricetes sp.]
MSDSFESIISDARLVACEYAFKQGFGGFGLYGCDTCFWRGGQISCRTKQNTDLVRRCMAIAERMVFIDED